MNALLDVFLVDDDRVSLRLMEKMLQRQGYPVRTASDPSRALRQIESDPPNILLTDWSMPQMNGGELCQSVREMQLPRYVYTIVLTANAQEFVVEALGAGADDFIRKPVDPNELSARISAGRRILDLEDQLKTLTEFDSVTGLLNRAAFFDRFACAFATAQESSTVLSCVMLDLDYFKSINDTHGHLAGDRVLQEVGQVLSRVASDEMIVGRYGGEEFVLALPGCGLDDAESLTYDIRDRLAQTPVDFGNGQFDFVTSSFGVAELRSSHHDAAQLVNAADQNLLIAKRLGRNITVCGQRLSEKTSRLRLLVPDFSETQSEPSGL